MPIDPVFAFADAVTDQLANRQQRLYALAYVRALQLHPGRPLTEALPPALYRPVRRFVAEAEWDSREVLQRAAAAVLPELEVEWLACRVSTHPRGYAWAWLGASTASRTVPLDLLLAGPDGTWPADDYLSVEVELLRSVPDALLRAAPLGIAGVLAERAELRTWLEGRGVTYSAKVRPSSKFLGAVRADGRSRGLPDLLMKLRRSQLLQAGPGGIGWAQTPTELRDSSGTVREETLVAYWDGPHLVSATLTNERDPAAVERTYDPAAPGWLARPRPQPSWRLPRMRGPRAWEHHLALNALLELYLASGRSSDD